MIDGKGRTFVQSIRPKGIALRARTRSPFPASRLLPGGTYMQYMLYACVDVKAVGPNLHDTDVHVLVRTTIQQDLLSRAALLS